MSRKKSKRKAPASDEERAERIDRLVMKTEVYLSYNLYNQATQAIDELLELDPNHLEGHRRRLEVLEETAAPEAVVRQLVTLARLTASEPVIANGFLKDARQRVEDGELRELAGEQGLELNEVLRVAVDSDELEDPPKSWPYVADETTRRTWLLRRLQDPSELFLESCSPPDGETFGPAARALSKAATALPASDERRAALFIEKDITYAIFTNRDFVAVHEVPAHALGRVVSKYKRTSLDAEEP